ncbi:MAG: fructosamine kinase family protein [Clostridiales bacterium]|nr:fructosamine kinase family protein [Clostridiales bacterium]
MKFYSLEEALTAAFGENTRIIERWPIYGGDINRTYRLTLSDGSKAFLKCNDIKNYDFFRAEEEGLNSLLRTEAIGVPKVLAVGSDRFKGNSFLLTEYLETKPKIKNYWEIFGRELAKLHRTKTYGATSENRELRFGFKTDNYIGVSKQINKPKTNWIEFFRDCRLKPQIHMAEKRLNSELKKKCEILLECLDSFLIEPEFPSLIHGDLWSGNALCGPDGKAWIFDPAVYIGNFEAELAMTELFGGYPASFYGAYNEVNHIGRGYKDRKDLYNLYHMLNHLNLFGASYLNAVSRIVNRYV